MKSNSRMAVDQLSKLSLLGTTALVASLGFMPMAYAQQAPGEEISDVIQDEDEDVVVTTGIRQSLKEARDLKRDADTAVDSITASDVGALPDLSVAEALSRVPGVVAQRFDITDGNGGDFPSPEGGGNLIRGLTLVRSEFNGRDTFSANGGRALDFGTIPPELIGAVDVYKNTTADLIEGGIGGTINLRTLEPFDRQGLVAVLSVDGTYTDLRDEWSPDFSAVLGNRWDTGAGEFGLLGSFSSSELKSELHGFQIGQVIPLEVGDQTIALPNGFQLRTNEVNRQRDSYYVAGQWENASGDLRLTAKYSRIENDTDSDERTLEYFGDGESFGQYDVTNLTTTPFSSAGLPNCNGSNDPSPANPTCEVTRPVSALYESGIISNSLRDWAGTDFQPTLRGAPFTNLGINQVDKSMTDDMSLNIKWRPTDRLYVQLDGHRTTAEFDRERLWVGTRFLSDFTLNADLDDPQITLVPDPTNDPLRRGGARGPLNSTDLSDPNNAFLKFAADEFQDNEGEMYALRADVEYEFDGDGWLDSVKFGARYADREQTNRQAGLNWAGVAPVWAGGYLPYADLDNPTFEVVDFSDFFRGGVVQGDNTSVIFADRNLIQNYDDFVATLASEPLIAQNTSAFGTPQFGDWSPLRVDGVVDYASRGQTGNIDETTHNLYGRVDFGKEFDNGMSLEGNFGLRYVRTKNSSVGVQGFAEVADNLATFTDENGNTVEIPNSRPSDFSPEAVLFLAGPDQPISASSTDVDWLPSFNAKWNITDESLLRLAISETLTRPNIADLRVDRTNFGQGQFIRDESLAPGEVGPPLDIRYAAIFQSGGNPLLEPITSVNFDLSYERYWGDNNFLSFAFFNKEIENNIIDASQTQGSILLDGEALPIIYTGKLNQDEAQVRGFEIAYQQFYDMLPGILGNLGVQANYTYISASANPPPGSVDADGDGAPDEFERIYRYGVDNFLGLSEDAVNLIGIYQDDKLEMRLAYNWRSEYLGSYRDFVTGNPIFQQPTGYLDGSIKYDLTENFQIRAQVANITDEKANSEQQIDAAGQRFGRTSFVGDRRIRIGARYQF